MSKAICLSLLFLAGAAMSLQAQIYVSTGQKIEEYDLNGNLINGSFITLGSQSEPMGLAVANNILYVADYGRNVIGEYNATTGAAINATFITEADNSGPRGLFLSGNYIFVANYLNNTVQAYGVSDGLLDLSFSGISQPVGVAISGNDLFTNSTSTIHEFSLGPGGSNNSNFANVSGYPGGIAISGNHLLVENNAGSGIVSEFDATTGAAINRNFITSVALTTAFGMTVVGNDLYIAYGNYVGEFDVNTGATINATLVPNAPSIQGVAVVPEPGSLTLVGGMLLLGIARFRRE